METAILVKNGLYCALGLVLTDGGTILSRYDSRQSPPVSRSFAEYGAGETRSLDSQIEQSIENGWTLVYRGRPLFEQSGVR